MWGGRGQQRVTFLLVIYATIPAPRVASGRTGREENVVLCSIHGYAMWKLKDRETVPTVDLAEASPPYDFTHAQRSAHGPFSVFLISCNHLRILSNRTKKKKLKNYSYLIYKKNIYIFPSLY